MLARGSHNINLFNSCNKFSIELTLIQYPLYHIALLVHLYFFHSVVANYMVWYIMQNRARNLDNRFRDLITEYNEVLSCFNTLYLVE
jgi:hypothetical protein